MNKISFWMMAGVVLLSGCGEMLWCQTADSAESKRNDGIKEKDNDFFQSVPFVSGSEGYHTFRIPAILVTVKGTILAFCEGRGKSSSDTGDINLLLKRSLDNGKTWQPRQTIWDDGANVCGNPCVVMDLETKTIWLLMTWNLGSDRDSQIIQRQSKDTRRVFVTFSSDDGKSWAKPKEITQSVKKPNWTWYATGPGVGIQLEKGPDKGRLIIPCDHIEAESKKYYSHIIYSDDHGKNWKLGGSTPTDQVNECQAVELTDGQIMLNMRNYDRSKKNRAISTSKDGGLTWSAVRHDKVLIEPICQASFMRYTRGGSGGKNRVLFANCASEKSRVKMTVRLSYDEGRTWPIDRMIYEGPSAYSCLTDLSNGQIGCFYECGEKSPYEKIAFARFSLEWLSKGKDR